MNVNKFVCGARDAALVLGSLLVDCEWMGAMRARSGVGMMIWPKFLVALGFVCLSMSAASAQQVPYDTTPEGVLARRLSDTVSICMPLSDLPKLGVRSKPLLQIDPEWQAQCVTETQSRARAAMAQALADAPGSKAAMSQLYARWLACSELFRAPTNDPQWRDQVTAALAGFNAAKGDLRASVELRLGSL